MTWKMSKCITALKMCQFDLFYNMYILLKILCTVSITTATVERSFSTIGKLKTCRNVL